jgi:hypothetical protein
MTRPRSFERLVRSRMKIRWRERLVAIESQLEGGEVDA